jgi:pimeloyl-ACP methyl ester carboxylesterase
MTWVLLRGLTRESRHWGDFPQQLQEATGRSPGQVITLDLPGNGKWFRQRSPFSVEEMAEAARRQLAAQGVRPPYAVLAMSLGGMAATSWAQRYPGEISRLVLVNTSMRPHAHFAQRLRPRSWLPLLAMAAHWRNIDAVEQKVHELTCKCQKQLRQDLKHWRFIRESAPVSAANAARQLWAASRFTCASLAPHCPVLVLSSAGDALVSPVCSAQLAHAWQAPHREHPWAGHDLPHDDPFWVCRQVAPWNELVHEYSLGARDK